MQIVNGGQTTASIYFSKKKNPEIGSAAGARPAKMIILRGWTRSPRMALISDISRYANSQNSVKLSDLSANKPFHVEMEKLALSIVLSRRDHSMVLRARRRQLQRPPRARGRHPCATSEDQTGPPREQEGH